MYVYMCETSNLLTEDHNQKQCLCPTMNYGVHDACVVIKNTCRLVDAPPILLLCTLCLQAIMMSQLELVAYSS